MKITFDIKSMVIGALAVTLCFTFISSRSSQDQFAEARYQTQVSATNMIVITDTHTGKYLITNQISVYGKVQWLKGSFDETFKTAKDNKKE